MISEVQKVMLSTIAKLFTVYAISDVEKESDLKVINDIIDAMKMR